MKKLLPLAITVLIALCWQACKPSYYTASDFSVKTKKHKIVAVLPVEMIFTGNKPKKVTEAQLDSLEIEESKMFQISLFNNLTLQIQLFF